MTTIYLFTSSFPYKAHKTENSFLQNEVRILSGHFKVILVPALLSEEKDVIPANVLINKSLAEFVDNEKRKTKYFLYFLKYNTFYKELLNKPSLLFSPRNLVNLVNYLRNAAIVSKWVKESLIGNLVLQEGDTIVLYTYWFTYITTGIILAETGKRNDIIKISRAHGIDLFEERMGYLPCQEQTINEIKKLFLPSKAGYDYLVKKFPDLIDKFDISYLGSAMNNKISNISDDGIFRIVSCSNINSVKRIELLISGLSLLSDYTSKSIIWTHIGNGPQSKEVLILSKTLKNVTPIFLGYLSNKMVLEYYESNKVDCFISTSSSEGGVPVSIQEAQSFGIPVIATSSGGIAEIVNNETGILLSHDPEPKEIAEAIIHLIENPSVLARMKNRSRENWEQNFNAEKNFREFADKLMNL